MSKCSWKDGEFMPCEHRGQYTNIETTCVIPHSLKTVSVSSNFCPFCGADIRKPEPEVIIKKSGETWVARFEGIDYLRVGGTVFIPLNEGDIKHLKLNPSLLVGHDSWKPISEIEITDEIAKLRPMVIIDGASPMNGDMGLLVYEKDGASTILIYCTATCLFSSSIRLATVADLEEER